MVLWKSLLNISNFYRKKCFNEEDHTFLVYIPEFGSSAHGDTLKEAKRMGEELIDLMLENDIID